LSGAVGNYAHVPPEVEAHVCEKLGLKVDTFSTQVIARDRFATYFTALGLLGSCVEAIAVELRHLQRTEVGEVREGFSKGQKGSSAMPHKRNPISAENLTGLARLLRGMVIPAMENEALWHERDISHSSVERIIAPDANILADYMLGRLNTLLSGLETFPDRMQANLDQLHGVVYSQRVLLSLVEAGLSRDEAYEIVQKNALQALDVRKPFRELLKQDPRVTKVLSHSALDMLFEPRHYFKHLDYLYKKVLS
jgi:adenylosuccinate lyase